jgi:hypothetical protein
MISLVQTQILLQPMPKTQQHILQLAHDERMEIHDPSYVDHLVCRALLILVNREDSAKKV